MERFNPKVEGINYEMLDELIGYAIRRAQLLIYEDFDATVGARDITAGRFTSLIIIENNPGISQTKLSEVLGVVRSAVVSIIDRFEEAGFVERHSLEDRRSYNLHLTEKGRKQLQKYKKAVKEHDERISKSLSEDERRQLRSLLEKICK